VPIGSYRARSDAVRGRHDRGRPSHQRSAELVALIFRRDADRGYETTDERRLLGEATSTACGVSRSRSLLVTARVAVRGPVLDRGATP